MKIFLEDKVNLQDRKHIHTAMKMMVDSGIGFESDSHSGRFKISYLRRPRDNINQLKQNLILIEGLRFLPCSLP